MTTQSKIFWLSILLGIVASVLFPTKVVHLSSLGLVFFTGIALNIYDLFTKEPPQFKQSTDEEPYVDFNNENIYSGDYIQRLYK